MVISKPQELVAICRALQYASDIARDKTETTAFGIKIDEESGISEKDQMDFKNCEERQAFLQNQLEMVKSCLIDPTTIEPQYRNEIQSLGIQKNHINAYKAFLTDYLKTLPGNSADVPVIYGILEKFKH